MPSLILNGRDSFLSQFDPLTRAHLIEFGKRLSRTESDVFMTMARKATCLVDCMDALGLTGISGTITSDRIKDMDLSWVKGKRVTLVDDVIVFGSTLRETRDLLLQAGAKSVQAIVHSVDKDRWDRKKIEPAPPYRLLTHAQTVSFCATIVDAISLLPMPYAVDYPVFSKVRVPVKDFNALFGLPIWTARDVSSPWQRENGVASITCTPPNEVLAELEERLGWQFTPISIAKIRLYARRHGEGRPYWQCSVLPIVTFRPLKEIDLNSIWNLLRTNSGLKDDVSWKCFASASSKLRLIQYIAAAHLADIWLVGVATQMRSTPVLGHSHRMLDHLFSPPSLGLVQKLLESPNPLFAGCNVVAEESDPIDVGIGAEARWMGHEAPTIRSRLAEPFIELERTAERRAQGEGKGVSDERWSQVSKQEPYNRLERGYTHTQLEAHMRHLGEASGEALSLFLDQAIDRGIVVPITATRNGFVYRAYRHGEDVLFSKGEMRLFALAIKACAEASGRPVLGHLVVEKLMVLLIRIGIHQRFLHPFLGAPGTPGTAGVRFSLHGAVAQVGISGLFGHDEDHWLSRLMVDEGLLEEKDLPDSHGTGYRAMIPSDASVYAHADNKAAQVGRIVGFLHKQKSNETHGSALVSLGEWTLLATCLNEPDVAAAIAAEIDIFCKQWRQWRLRITANKQSAETDSGDVIASQLRQSKLFTAINSGKWKYESHLAGIPKKLIYSEVPSRLADAVYQSVWTEFWPPETEEGKDGGDPQVVELLAREASLIYEVNIYVRLLGVAFMAIAATTKSGNDLGELRELIMEMAAEIEDIGIAFSANCPQLSSIASRDVTLLQRRLADGSFEPLKVRDYSIAQLEKLAVLGGALLAEASIKVGNFGRALPLARYPHALHIDVGLSAIENQGVFQRVKKLIQSFVIRSKKAEGQAIEQIPSGEGTIRHGFWICGRSAFARRWLIQLAAELMATVGQDAPIRCVFFAELPRNVQLMRPEWETRYVNPAFWARAEAVINGKLGWPKQTELHIITDQEFLPQVRSEVEHMSNSARAAASKNRFLRFYVPKPDRAKRIELNAETGESAMHLHVVTRSASLAHQAADEAVAAQRTHGVKTRWPWDIGVLTIISPEVRAVLDHLKHNRIPIRAPETGRIYYPSTISIPGSRPLKVVVTQALTQGNRSVISAFEHLISDYRPRWIVLLGIAGGIHKDAKLCDVVIAEQSVYYDKRAETEKGASHRGEGYKIPSALLSIANALIVESDVIEASPNSPEEKFKVLLGPLGTGEAVIKFQDAEVRKWLHNYNDKALALETEAGGAGQAMYETELNRERGPEGLLVLRGISDHADAAKDDKWQQPAAGNAFRVLERFASMMVRLGLFK